MPPRKSIYRNPGAQHFQLVHRSVRDPLINDPDASQQVFKPIERANDARKTGVTLADLEASVDKSAIRANEGEAALYGITYDDSGYDYMSHLREVGLGGEGTSMLLAAPRGSGVARGMKGGVARSKGKGRAHVDADGLFVMPAEAMASAWEMSVAEAHASAHAVPPELAGFQPDMDPHLRQVLEALDDDAFVDPDAEDGDMFDELLGGGELEDGDEAEEFEFKEWGVGEDPVVARIKAYGPVDGDGTEVEASGSGSGSGEAKEETWEDRFRAFKEAGGLAAIKRQAEEAAEAADVADDDGIDDAERSEMADTVGSLASHVGDMLVVGGKKRRGKRGPSDATGMSMSSSSMWRNHGLRTLDDRFDRIEREYEMDDDEDEDYPDDDTVSYAPSYVSGASRASFFSTASRASIISTTDVPAVSREDFDAILDDFLDNYEVVGNRMRESLGATSLSGPEKLRVLRAAIDGDGDGDVEGSGDAGIGRAENKRRILELERIGRAVDRREKRDKLPMREVVGDKEDKWDVETILTTYTNTDNHPGMIRSRSATETKRRAEARARREAEAAAAQAEAAAAAPAGYDDDDDSGSETETETPRVTVARKKGESAEERKARKAGVKAERSARRAEKKQHKETFGTERKRQLASHQKLVANGRAADLSVASAHGVVSLR
ncbi:Protein ltv1 [Cryptotrichosporon argae]